MKRYLRKALAILLAVLLLGGALMGLAEEPAVEPSDKSDFVTDGDAITGYTGPGGDVILPSDWVTRIEGGAFSDCDTITSVVIPEGVTDIGLVAFQGCDKLEKVVIPSSVTQIQQGAFSNCPNLKEVVLSEGLEFIGDSVFMNDTSLENILLPDGVSWIDGWAFNGCTSLKSIELPDSVTLVGPCCFQGCSSLEYVICYDTLPQTSNTTGIGYDAFADCDTARLTVYVYTQNTDVDSFAKQYCDSNGCKCEQYPYGTPLPPGSTEA